VTTANLLADLRAAGVTFAREDDDLRVRAKPGVELAPHLDLVRANKPALLRALLQEQILAALTVAPDRFDRGEYERLVVLWKQHGGEEHEP
jgi:hypothetical protein